jgi:uncharacterized protein with GYD domain
VHLHKNTPIYAQLTSPTRESQARQLLASPRVVGSFPLPGGRSLTPGADGSLDLGHSAGVERGAGDREPQKERRPQMAYYLVQAAYTAEAWAAMVQDPQNRAEVIRPVIDRLGGSLVGTWLAFGEYDVVAILQLPDPVSAAALSLAASAGGAVRALKTTPLLTMEEGMAAMRQAAGAGYRPPRITAQRAALMTHD